MRNAVFVCAAALAACGQPPRAKPTRAIATARPPSVEPAASNNTFVEGRVTDSATGEALVGVTMRLTNLLDGATPTAITGEDGTYRVDLPPGRYQMTAYYATIELAHATTITAVAGEVTRADEVLDHAAIEAAPEIEVIGADWDWRSARDCSLPTFLPSLTAGHGVIDCGVLVPSSEKPARQAALRCIELALVQRQAFVFSEAGQGIDSEVGEGFFAIYEDGRYAGFRARYDSDPCGGSCGWNGHASVQRCKVLRVVSTANGTCDRFTPDCLSCDGPTADAADCRRGEPPPSASGLGH